MDLLNISYTEESSVLTESEMSFTLYENTNMANTGFSRTQDLTSDSQKRAWDPQKTIMCVLWDSQ